MNPKICIPIVTSSLSIALLQMEQFAPKADALEIWLGEFFQTDCFSMEEVESTIDAILEVQKTIQLPLLFTIKDSQEQGNFGGTHEQKKQIALLLLQKNVDFLDLDYNFDIEWFEEIKALKMQTKTQLILSAHFFEGTPSFPSLKNRVQLMQNRGADMVKVAAMPRNQEEVLDILKLAENLHRKKIRYIAISMGSLGKISRVLAPLWGSEFAFAPVSIENSSANGQIPEKNLRTIWELLG